MPTLTPSAPATGAANSHFLLNMRTPSLWTPEGVEKSQRLIDADDLTRLADCRNPPTGRARPVVTFGSPSTRHCSHTLIFANLHGLEDAVCPLKGRSISFSRSGRIWNRFRR